MRGYIAVDFDGTLVTYETWRGIEHVGEPIQPMVARVRAWLAQGWEVRIMTNRVAGADSRQAVEGAKTDPRWNELRDVDRAREVVQRWCEQHLGVRLVVQNHKTGDMVELWDDRAVQVERNTGRVIGYSTRDDA